MSRVLVTREEVLRVNVGSVDVRAETPCPAIAGRFELLRLGVVVSFRRWKSLRLKTWVVADEYEPYE